MRSVSADFVFVGDNRRVERVAKTGRLVKLMSAVVNRMREGTRWLVPRSASGASALFEHWELSVS